MKGIDITVAVLLVMGGLNWGLVGIYGFDLLASLLGDGSVATRTAYAVLGISALYQAVNVPVIRRRWRVAPLRIRVDGPSRDGSPVPMERSRIG